ncbi:hypothetical protein ACFY36_37790 [Actinoplanes sp. NPDC000266]
MAAGLAGHHMLKRACNMRASLRPGHGAAQRTRQTERTGPCLAALGHAALGHAALGRVALGHAALGRVALGRVALGRVALGRVGSRWAAPGRAAPGGRVVR